MIHCKLDWIKSKPIAHRGLHGNEIPENSVAAFENALTHNLPIELDVQLTSDKKIIVFHDDSFLRLTGVDKYVNLSSWDSIKEYRINHTSQTIPLLSDVLDLVNGKVPLLIETKNFYRPNALEENLVELLKSYRGEFAVQSFNPLAVRWLKNNAPEIMRGQISARFREMPVPLHYKYILRNLTLNFTAKPHFINYNIDDLPYLPVELYRNHGLPILSWTVQTKAQLLKARELCDNFVFEKLSPEDIVK